MSLEEIDDIESVLDQEVLDLSDVIIPFSFEDRRESFTEEWIAFIKKEISENFEPWFYMWLSMSGANSSFLCKMEKLANKHFRGILTRGALTRLQIFVKQLLYGITAFISATKGKELEPILLYVETFSKESFEALEHWCWPLTNAIMSKLQAYRPEDSIEEPLFDKEAKEANGGFPSWIEYRNTKSCF
jgi:hypothetical protein